jgi:hypothetical protein
MSGCQLSSKDFQLIIQALTQLSDDGRNLAARLGHTLSPLPTEAGVILQISDDSALPSGVQDPAFAPPRGDCPRNSKKLVAGMRWKIGDKMARTSTASSDAIISALAGIHPESNTMSPDSWMDSIRHHQWALSRSQHDDGLLSVIHRCHVFTSKDVGAKFMLMLSYIELSVTCQRYAILKLPVASPVANNRNQDPR